MRRVSFLAGLVCVALVNEIAQEEPVVNKAATAKFAPTPSAATPQQGAVRDIEQI